MRGPRPSLDKKPMQTWADLFDFRRALEAAYVDGFITRDEQDDALDKAREELAAYRRARP